MKKKRTTSETTATSLPPNGAFTLRLDLRYFFEPLMQDFGNGISFSRTIQLPFPPSGSVAIGGKSIEGQYHPPLGYRLSDLVWDYDRQVFLATTTECHAGSPLAILPFEIRTFIDNGWQPGSWQQSYDDEWEDVVEETDRLSQISWDTLDDDELAAMETMPASQRPAQFSDLLTTVVRMLFKPKNNEAVAYAIHKTKKYYEDVQSAPEVYAAAVHKFESMDSAEQERTVRGILKRKRS